MNRRFLLASFVGAVILFVWGFVFWALLNGGGSLNQVPTGADNPISTVLQEHLSEDGTYYAPPMPDNDAGQMEWDTWESRHKTGPIYSIIYRKEGADVMSPMMMVLGFLHYLAATMLVCWLLTMVSGSLQTTGQRVTFIVILGIFASVFIDFSDAIWMYHPWYDAIASLLYSTVAWLLAGLGIVYTLKPKAA